MLQSPWVDWVTPNWLSSFFLLEPLTMPFTCKWDPKLEKSRLELCRCDLWQLAVKLLSFLIHVRKLHTSTHASQMPWATVSLFVVLLEIPGAYKFSPHKQQPIAIITPCHCHTYKLIQLYTGYPLQRHFTDKIGCDPFFFLLRSSQFFHILTRILILSCHF